jgi:hypothetical protein
VAARVGAGRPTKLGFGARDGKKIRETFPTSAAQVGEPASLRRGAFGSDAPQGALELHGEHDLSTANKLDAVLVEVARSATTLVVDLSTTSFIDSIIIGRLARFQQVGERLLARSEHELRSISTAREGLPKTHGAFFVAVKWERNWRPTQEHSMSTVDRGTLWQWREHTWESDRCQLEGFRVEARGGSIGKIDEATDDVGSSYIVVDTGPWIFGKKVMLPASIIERVDYDHKTVYVSVTKERIKNAPEFEATTYRDAGYRSRLGDYYGRDL